MKTKIVIITALITCALFLCAFDKEAVYADVTTQITLEKLASGDGESDNMDFAEKYLSFCNRAKRTTIAVIPGSIGIGVMILMAVKKDMTIKKKAVFGFIIGFPLIYIGFVYLACYAYGMLF